MPQLGLTMESGTVIEWFREEGDEVIAGEPLFVVEMDKSSVEVEAQANGILHILPDLVGEELPVGTVIGHIEGHKEATVGRQFTEDVADAVSAAEPEGPPAETQEPVEPSGPSTWSMVMPNQVLPLSPSTQATAMPGRVLPSSTATRREEPPKQVEPSSPGRWARVTSNQALPPAPAWSGVQPSTAQVTASARPTPMQHVRKVIADRMATSAHTTAPVTLTIEADATQLVQLRKQLKARLEGGGEPVPTFNDILVVLVGRALVEHPALNATLTDEGITQHPTVHVGLAVDTPRGLLVPVIRDVPDKRLLGVAAESRLLVEQALSGQITPDDLRGGTFTITNLGMYGVETFTPIINLPECAIVGVGSIRPRPVVTDAGQLVARETVWLSLTFDHRLVDGGPAARFLQRVKELIEQPPASLLA